MSSYIVADERLIALARYAAEHEISRDGVFQSLKTSDHTAIQSRMMSIIQVLYHQNMRSVSQRHENAKEYFTTPEVLEAHAATTPPEPTTTLDICFEYEYQAVDDLHYSKGPAYRLINTIIKTAARQLMKRADLIADDLNRFGPGAKMDGTTGPVSILSMINK